jgi:trans-2-enoyl-CoA reductase
MKQMVTVVCCHEYGRPDKVAQVERWPIGEIKPNEALVLMKAAPLSPADLNVLEGRYAIRPELPCVPGNEGVGVVAQKGIAVSNVRVGQHVIHPGYMGAWCEAYVAPATELVPLPPGIEFRQASMASVIVPTAWRLLHDFVSLKAGAWVVQNAANSAVGRWIIVFARHQRIKTLNVVRRENVKDDLLALGGDVVLTEEELSSERVGELTGGHPPVLGFNTVSGHSAQSVARTLAPRGTLVTYGAMSREPFMIGNGDLIFRDLTLRGFWITEWLRRASAKDIAEMYAAILPMMRERGEVVPVEKSFTLDEAREAIAASAAEGRNGKILFEMN